LNTVRSKKSLAKEKRAFESVIQHKHAIIK
jgi:hypothetical protein